MQAEFDIINYVGNELKTMDVTNHIVTLQSVYEKIKDRIPWKVGVICPVTDDIDGLSETTKMKTVKKAQRMDRTRSCAEMLLMMFRSANRDRRASRHPWASPGD